MKIRKRIFPGLIAAVLLFAPMMAYASGGEEYITISVDASDDNEGLTYALDNPDNFGPSNTFTIPAGTSHTIYVKDAAGNVTSQVYDPPTTSSASSNPGSNYSGYSYSSTREDNEEEQGRTINIDLELGKSTDNKAYEIKQETPAEQGEGTVYSKTFLDGTDSSEQVFYSVTTTDGDVFYLLIDQGQSDNNVYLLNQVSNKDLSSLATDDDSTSENVSKKNSDDDSLLKALSTSGSNDNAAGSGSAPKASGGINKNAVILVLIMGVGGGVYYYQRVYKTKKEQEMDAMEAADMEQFEADAEEDDEYDFGYGEEDKEQFLKDLMERDKAEYEATGGWDGEPDAEAITDNGMLVPEDDIFSDNDTETDREYDAELDGEEE